MASANKMEPTGRQPIPPAKRRQLQQCFEHGSKSTAQGNFDYASVMFTQCVLGDPGNPIYTKGFLDNLFRKYANNKKGSKMASMQGLGAKGSIKKASMSKDWVGVIKSSLDMLKLNPWDVPTLQVVATACEELNFAECQLLYLKTALDTNPKDPDINRACGRALARGGNFDQAIACFHRVVQAKPGDEEAQRAIADLAVEKTISNAGYEDATSSTDVRAAHGDDDEDSPGRPKLTPEQQLEKAISKNPGDLSNYTELADMHLRNERMQDAEVMLAKALEVSGGDLSVRERLEDVQLRRAREQLTVAENQAKEKKTQEAVDLAKQMKGELNRLETDVYRSRSDRYPTNLGLKFELGVRLKRGGQYKEAIQYFQTARADTKRKATVLLELGECFQHLKQLSLAMSNYEAAIEAIPEREVDQRKLVLYRAGKLALFNKDIDRGEKYLTQLASLEFGYKDVPELLDKIANIRNKG